MLLVFSFNDFIQIQKISTAGQYAFDILTGLLRDEICCNGMSKVYMKVVNVYYEPYHEKTNILVFDLVQHKPGCTATEDG